MKYTITFHKLKPYYLPLLEAELRKDQAEATTRIFRIADKFAKDHTVRAKFNDFLKKNDYINITFTSLLNDIENYKTLNCLSFEITQKDSDTIATVIYEDHIHKWLMSMPKSIRLLLKRFYNPNLNKIQRQLKKEYNCKVTIIKGLTTPKQ